MNELAAEIGKRLSAAGRPQRRRSSEWYTPTAMQVLGVTVPAMRAIRRDVSKRIRKEEARDVLGLARAVIAQDTFEGRHLAYELLVHHKPALASLTTKGVEVLGKGMDNWATVDTFGCYLSGRCWREGQVTDAAVRRWARSRDRWWRRAALVSTVPLNQKSHGGTGDPKRTLDICTRLAADDEDMVAKALSWALRTLVPHDRAGVEAFLERNGDVLAARVLRETRNKLATGRKNR